MLDRCEYVESALLVFREVVEFQSSGVDAVRGLLSDHGFVRGKVYVVTASSIFLKMMEFCSKF